MLPDDYNRGGISREQMDGMLVAHRRKWRRWTAATGQPALGLPDEAA